MLCSANKATQNRDIEKALELNRLLKDFPQRRKHSHPPILNPGSGLHMTLQAIYTRLKRWLRILSHGLMNAQMMCLG